MLASKRIFKTIQYYKYQLFVSFAMQSYNTNGKKCLFGINAKLFNYGTLVSLSQTVLFWFGFV